MKNFSFEKNKNIYIIRYKEWELCMDIEKEIIINNKTGEIIDYETMRTTVFEDLIEACDEGQFTTFISGIWEEPKIMEPSILISIGFRKEKEHFFSEMRKRDKIYSLTISNPNLNVFLDYNGDIPEGFVDFCLKNDITLNGISYEAFQLSKKINDYPEDVRLLVAQFDKMINNSKLPKRDVVKILRCYKNSLLKYGEYTFDGCHKLSNVFTAVATYPELIKLIDTQSSFALATNAVGKNYKLLKDQENQERIKKSQKRIKELETLVYKDYCFIVPTTLKELIDEGEQQHNCIGSFYNDSMSKGKNFIYFIRKKDNPEKSYITCRFNVETNETEEARYKFNDEVSKEEDIKAILKSSEFIKKIIETKEVKNDKKVRVKTIAANDLPTEGALPTWTFEF
nr:MAG TPA: PcfJ like protein [Caudoviricetes sp.]